MVLQTERLRLRPLGTDDLDDIARLVSDPEVVAYLGDGLPRSRERAGVTVANAVRMWDSLGYGPFTIEREGGFVGVCLLIPIAHTGIDSTDLEARGPEIEIGYWLARNAWGYGFATEAARAVLEWAMSEIGPGLDRLVAVTHPANERSKRVLQRLGMRCVGETDRFYGATTTHFETGGA